MGNVQCHRTSYQCVIVLGLKESSLEQRELASGGGAREVRRTGSCTPSTQIHGFVLLPRWQ